ncbi:MAG: stage III sporulation protein AE [Clostridia bacterium]|nr:stage III sporulation protein AE [Clostridia bacterium]
MTLAKHFKQNKCNKTTIILMVILISLFSIISPLQTFCATDKLYNLSEDMNNTVIEELQEIDFSGFNEVIDEFNANNTNIFSIDNIKSKVYSIISGESAVNYSNFFASLFSELIEMVVKYLPMISLIIAIGVVSNLLNGVKSKFNEKSTGDLINLVCFLSVAILIIGIVTTISKSIGKAIDSMVNQMNILFPILLTLMTALGANASVGVFKPVVAIISTYVADFFNYFIVPLFMVSFVFGIISNMSTNIKLDKFNSFISSLFKWTVGLVFTLFFAIFSIQGIAVSRFDSLSIRTTKYTIKSYIPIMGGYLSDGMDLILSSTMLIKNSVGLVGILMIISTILSPLLEIVVFSLMLKLVSAVLQPLGNSKTSNFLSATSKSITMLSTAIIAIGFMYLISIGLVMTTSNVVV